MLPRFLFCPDRHPVNEHAKCAEKCRNSRFFAKNQSNEKPESPAVFCFAAAFAPLIVQCQSGQAQKVRLIIRIDDMGCSHATNTGIREAYKEGIGRSVEVMVPTPWFPEAVRMLKEMPGLDAGVHLVLTSEWTNVKWRPLTQVPSLVNDWGYFYPMIWPNDRFPAGSALQEHPWDIKEVEKELRAQIELAKREIPQLSHLSSHMGCLNMNDETKALFKNWAGSTDWMCSWKTTRCNTCRARATIPCPPRNGSKSSLKTCAN